MSSILERTTMTTIQILILLFVLFELVDVVTTLVGLKKGATEVNKYLRRLFNKFGAVPTLAVVKGSLVGVALYFQDQLVLNMMIFVVVVSFIVMTDNLWQLHKAKVI